MADTLTANYGWTKPDPGGDANTWGSTLNATTDKIDAQVFANAQAGCPVGTILMWAGATPPANWLLCAGQSLATSGTYAALFAVCRYAYGGSGASFNLPNLSQRFPMGAGGGTLGATGGEATHTLIAAEMPSHAHGVSDPTHAHGVADPTHVHGVSDPTHAHGVNQTPHSHTGILRPTGANTHAAAGSADSAVASTDAATIGISIAASGTGVSIAAAATGVAIYAAATGISIQAAGGGAAHNNIPPFLAVNFIIRAF